MTVLSFTFFNYSVPYKTIVLCNNTWELVCCYLFSFVLFFLFFFCQSCACEFLFHSTDLNLPLCPSVVGNVSRSQVTAVSLMS